VKKLGILFLSLFGVVGVGTATTAISVSHTDTMTPGTLMLLGSGLVALGTWGRKKFFSQRKEP
jgi:hypothetical protein